MMAQRLALMVCQHGHVQLPAWKLRSTSQVCSHGSGCQGMSTIAASQSEVLAHTSILSAIKFASDETVDAHWTFAYPPERGGGIVRCMHRTNATTKRRQHGQL